VQVASRARASVCSASASGCLLASAGAASSHACTCASCFRRSASPPPPSPSRDAPARAASSHRCTCAICCAALTSSSPPPLPIARSCSVVHIVARAAPRPSPPPRGSALAARRSPRHADSCLPDASPRLSRRVPPGENARRAAAVSCATLLPLAVRPRSPWLWSSSPTVDARALPGSEIACDLMPCHADDSVLPSLLSLCAGLLGSACGAYVLAAPVAAPADACGAGCAARCGAGVGATDCAVLRGAPDGT
jgi:hypothetical protein